MPVRAATARTREVLQAAPRIEAPKGRAAVWGFGEWGGGTGRNVLGWRLLPPRFRWKREQRILRHRKCTEASVMSEQVDLGVVIQPYQPRAEGGLALIERRTYLDGESTGHSLDRANVRFSYGNTATARLSDNPAAPLDAWSVTAAATTGRPNGGGSRRAQGSEKALV
jgi:hypothetical protein